MKIATHHEIEHKWPSLLARIANGEEIGTWSVQNTDYDDDIYNGTYNQCAKEAKRIARETKRDGSGIEIAGIALIQLDKNGSAVYTHDFVSLEDL